MTAPDDLVRQARNAAIDTMPTRKLAEDTLYWLMADEIVRLRERVAELEAENARLKERLEVQFKRLTSMDGLLANAEAERDALAAAMPSEGADAALAYAAMKTERDALRAERAESERDRMLAVIEAAKALRPYVIPITLNGISSKPEIAAFDAALAELEVKR